MPVERKEASQALAHLRRESLDLYNRLHSIAEDVVFVNLVQTSYPGFPMLPNLRCGAWYTDPRIAGDIPAYFKSTDGHFGNWSFNLRRPNLHLLPLVIEYNGLTLVDSTRDGKRMPDALSKTVPIWCAVINRALAKNLSKQLIDGWDKNLYTPPQVVSAQEHAQIEARLDHWADALAMSSYVLPHLSRPLRPLWITPTTTNFPDVFTIGRNFIPVICISASKQVHDGVERRAGYAYVQGSGDDHELWGMGLTSTVFWQHHDELLKASRRDLPNAVESVVSAAVATALCNDWVNLPTPITKTAGRLAICANSDIPSPLPLSLSGEASDSSPAAYLQITANETTVLQSQCPDMLNYLRIIAPEGKKGQLKFLQNVLPRSVAFISQQLHNGYQICISCDTGKDASTGVALVALQKFFDDDGRFLDIDENHLPADKGSIQTRLQWIISSRPQANPSRATLKRVNEFLLTSGLFNRTQPLLPEPRIKFTEDEE